MSGSMIGMDVNQVRELAKQMKSTSTEINSLVKKLTSQLQSAQWVGNDQKKFVGDWNGSYVPSLNKVTQALNENAQRAEKNAAEQEQVSSR